MGFDHFKDFGSQSAGDPHFFDVFGRFYADAHARIGFSSGANTESISRGGRVSIVEARQTWYKGLLFLATTHTYRHVRQGAFFFIL